MWLFKIEWATTFYIVPISVATLRLEHCAAKDYREKYHFLDEDAYLETDQSCADTMMHCEQ